MAKEDERPTAAEKGKGKADDSPELNGDKKDAKDKKPVADGKKKDEEPQEGMVDLRPRPSSSLQTTRNCQLTRHRRCRGTQRGRSAAQK